MMVYTVAALILMAWAIWHLAFGRRSGVVGKILYFLVAIEAGAVCFPARFHLPSPAAMLPILAVTIIYQEVFMNYRRFPH